MTTGLRERRKQETRRLVSDIATHLFVARGFDEVTISQVAEAAGVAKMTVTNYFPRKEDLVFDRAEAVIGHLAGVVAARAPGESMLTAVRRDYAVRGGPGRCHARAVQSRLRPDDRLQPGAGHPGTGNAAAARARARGRDGRRDRR